MKKRVFAYLCAFIMLAGCLSGCGNSETGGISPANAEQQSMLFAMDTYMQFRIYGDASALDGVKDMIQDMERRISVTSPDSEIATVNRNGGGTVSDETAQLLRTALDLCTLTRGALDISVYPVVRAWGFTTGDYRIPSYDERLHLLESVDYTKIHLDGNTVTLADGMEIDLGAVAKGYAGRQAANFLREQNVTSALLDMGGNVQTVGSKPDGSPWRVAVQDPQSDGYAGIMEIVDKAAVTSGGYQRFFTGDDGKTYWHIMDPAEGKPAQNGLLSVTVVAQDGAVCDALSTALFVMGAEKAQTFWRRNADLNFEMVLITEPDADGHSEMIVTPGLSFTPESNPLYTLRTLS